LICAQHRRARRGPPNVSATLTAWGFTDTAWLAQAVLVVSELVANAVRHGGGCLAWNCWRRTRGGNASEAVRCRRP
jgi:hypothetical protein